LRRRYTFDIQPNRGGRPIRSPRTTTSRS
jgi:hypothetical protein